MRGRDYGEFTKPRLDDLCEYSEIGSSEMLPFENKFAQSSSVLDDVPDSGEGVCTDSAR